MIYTLDTEFIDNGVTIDLLSLGLVCEDERVFYLQNADAKFQHAAPWVREHVFPHLQRFDLERLQPQTKGNVALPPWFAYANIGQALRMWIGTDAHPIFWGYYSDYDWVALCQLFGTMMDLPAGWPMYCRDLRQWLDDHECEGIVQGDTDEAAHDALEDARWIMRQLQEYVYPSSRKGRT